MLCVIDRSGGAHHNAAFHALHCTAPHSTVQYSTAQHSTDRVDAMEWKDAALTVEPY